MDGYIRYIATSPGGSDSPQEATSLCLQGSTEGLKSNPKTTGVPAQASVGTHVGVQRCAPTDIGIGKLGDNTDMEHKSNEI